MSSAPGKDVIPVVLVSVAPPLLVLVIAVALYRARRRRRRKDGPPRPPTLSPVGKNPPELLRTAVESDGPTPVFRLEVAVGGGGSARVWRARLLNRCPDGGSTVAAKVFPAARAASWRCEAAILADGGMRHRNVVEFLGAQVTRPASRALYRRRRVARHKTLSMCDVETSPDRARLLTR